MHQEAKQEIIQDLMRALVASDIAFEKMDNPVMREFLKNGGAIPGANGLRLHLRTVYDAHRSDLTEIFHRHKTFFSERTTLRSLYAISRPSVVCL